MTQGTARCHQNEHLRAGGASLILTPTLRCRGVIRRVIDWQNGDCPYRTVMFGQRSLPIGYFRTWVLRAAILVPRPIAASTCFRAHVMALGLSKVERVIDVGEGDPSGNYTRTMMFCAKKPHAQSDVKRQVRVQTCAKEEKSSKKCEPIRNTADNFTRAKRCHNSLTN